MPVMRRGFGIRLVCVGLFLAGGASCIPPGITCEADEDCADGARCDLEYLVCVRSACSGCADHEECEADQCVPRYSGIEILEPQAGAEVVVGAPLRVRARLVVAEGRTSSPPASLALIVSSVGGHVVMPAAQPGEFEATITLEPPVGERTLLVRHAAASLTSETRTISVIAPELGLIIPPAPSRAAPAGGTSFVDPQPLFASAWRRDEEIPVLLASPGAITTVTRIVASIGNGAEKPLAHSPVVTSRCPSGSTFCAEVRVKLWEIEMAALRGELHVEADARTSTGATISASATTKVTRVKWSHSAGGTIRATPAIAEGGLVILATEASSTSGSLVALLPDGTVHWNRPSGRITASPVVGRTALGGFIYVAENASSGAWIHRIAPLDGQSLDRCGPYSGASIEATPMLMQATSTSEYLVTVVNGLGALVTMDSSGAIDCSESPTGPADFPTNVVRKGTTIYFAERNATIRAFVAAGSGWTPRSGWSVGNWSGMRGLAVLGEDLIWSHAEGLASGETVTGGLGDTVITQVQHGGVAVGAPDLVRTGIPSGAMHQVDWSAQQQSPLPHSPGTIRGAPLHGEGGYVYTSSDGGGLAAWKLPTGSPQWTATEIEGGEASLAIDCTRTGAGLPIPGAPGVLYVPSADGVLRAIIVDSRGLDVTAPWPRYQRDPRNSGVADVVLADFACP